MLSDVLAAQSFLQYFVGRTYTRHGRHYLQSRRAWPSQGITVPRYI